MGNVLRGGILTYLMCLITPHVLVFILTMIGSEINKGYLNGVVIGGSMTGSILLFLMTLFIAFTPLISIFILNGSGVAQAGAVVASLGANHVMSLPKRSMGAMTNLLATGSTGKLGMIGKNLKEGLTATKESNFKKAFSNNRRNGKGYKKSATSSFSQEKPIGDTPESKSTKTSSDTTKQNSRTRTLRGSLSSSGSKPIRSSNNGSGTNTNQGYVRDFKARRNDLKSTSSSQNNTSKFNRRNNNATISKRGRGTGRDTIKTSRFNKR